MKNPFELHFNLTGMHSKIYSVRDKSVFASGRNFQKYCTTLFYFYHKHVTV